MSDAHADLLDRMARAIRDAVRIRIGPNATVTTTAGGSVHLTSAEALEAARAAITVMQAEVDRRR